MGNIGSVAINLTIDDKKVTAKEGDSVLDAAAGAGIQIPSLCHLNMHDSEIMNQPASCRICMVERVDEHKSKLIPACVTLVSEGMAVKTNSQKVLQTRRKIIELMLSDHSQNCLECAKNLNCELQKFAADLGVKRNYLEGETTNFPDDTSSYSLVREPEKCILCRRCEAVCEGFQSVGVLSEAGRGFNVTIDTALGAPIMDTECTFCGQCAAVCPTAAITGAVNTTEIWAALTDPEKYVIVQTAPAVRAALSETFELSGGASATGKMAAALRRLGFDQVLDTNFAADVTIVEESTELMHRVKNGGKLPLITSCCPSGIKFIEHRYPDLLEHPSSCKSPQEMFGALAKSYLAEKLGVDPAKIVVVAIMPCLAKKFETKREELENGGHPNVDHVISTREFVRMLEEAGISLKDLPDEEFDAFMGDSSGAADIFGATGGVLEAILRSFYELSTDKKLEKLEYEMLRGSKGVKEAKIDLNGDEIKVAVVHGLKKAKILLDDIRDGKSEYHVIEIMACPGGCIAGGGQPYHYANEEVLTKRREALYSEDKSKNVRRSHENEAVKNLYDEFLGEPCGEKANELLHTSYIKR